MKKVLVALGMFVATSALADFKVTTALTISEAQGCIHQIDNVAVIDEKCGSTLTYTHDDGVRYVLTIDSYSDEHAVLKAQVIRMDAEGKDIVLSRPVLVAQWGKEASIRVGKTYGDKFEGLGFRVTIERV